MAKVYTTKSGDTWDLIAYEQMGDCRYMGLLMDANRAHVSRCCTDYPAYSEGRTCEDAAALEEVRT